VGPIVATIFTSGLVTAVDDDDDDDDEDVTEGSGKSKVVFMAMVRIQNEWGGGCVAHRMDVVVFDTTLENNKRFMIDMFAESIFI
jgi:hypothetical protein